MKFLFNKEKDERLVHTQNKIYREIYLLVLLICLLSVAIKFYLHGVQMESIYTEVIILVVQGMYFSYRSASMGIFTDEVEMHDRTSKLSMQKKNLVIGLAFSFVIALFFGIRSAILYGDGGIHSIYTFGIVFFASCMIYVPFLIFILVMSYEMMKRRSDSAVRKQLGDGNNE